MNQLCQIPIPASKPSQKCFLPCGPSYQPGYSVYQVNYYVPTCQSHPRIHTRQASHSTTSQNNNCPPPPLCPIPCQPLQVAPAACQEPYPVTCSEHNISSLVCPIPGETHLPPPQPQPVLQLPPQCIPLPPPLIPLIPQTSSNDICSGCPPPTPSCLEGVCYDYKDNIASLFNNLV